MARAGLLRRADTRVKLIWALALNFAAIMLPAVPVLLASILVICLVAVLGGVFAKIVLRFKGFWALMLVIALIQGLTIPQGRVLLRFPPAEVPLVGGLLQIYEGGLFYGFVSVLRLFVLTMPIFVLTETATISSLVAAFNWIGLPYEYSLMLSLALSFFPTVLSDLSAMMDALRSRGCRLVDSSFKRFLALKYVVVPLSLGIVEKADQLGKVLELRGYMRSKAMVQVHGCSRLGSVLLALSLVPVVVAAWMAI